MNDPAKETVSQKWEAVCVKQGDPPFQIVYEDDQLLLCRKAPGIPVQSASLRQQDLVSLLKNMLWDRDHTKQPYLGVVHRLDQPVQGLVVFAKTPFAAASLSRQIQEGVMEKSYLCVCSAHGLRQAKGTGPVLQEKGTLRDYLKKDGAANCSCVVAKGTPGAKEAILDYEILMREKEYCLVAVRLHTGRHHQIRVQLAHAGLPIVGDKKYGKAGPGTGSGTKEGELRLCAYRLSFLHPKTGRPLSFILENGGFRQL